MPTWLLSIEGGGQVSARTLTTAEDGPASFGRSLRSRMATSTPGGEYVGVKTRAFRRSSGRFPLLPKMRPAVSDRHRPSEDAFQAILRGQAGFDDGVIGVPASLF